jgi:hypothetical protein
MFIWLVVATVEILNLLEVRWHNPPPPSILWPQALIKMPGRKL